MAAFFGALGAYSGTFGSTLNAKVQGAASTPRAHKYGSALEASLDGPNIPDLGLHAARRRREQEPADVPSLPEAAQADDGRRTSCTTTISTRRWSRRCDLELHAGGSAEATSSTRARAARPRLRRRGASAPSTSAGSICYPDRRQASGAYSNGGAYDVHPYMLINYNGKYDDVSTLAHELGPHDAELLLEQDAAVSARELSDLRRRGRVDVQRGAAHRLHAEDDQGRRRPGCRCSATISRTSRARSSARRSSPSSSCACTRWRRRAQPITGDALDQAVLRTSRRSTTATTRASASSTTTSPTSGAIIPHFYRDFYVFQYATSFTASAALAEKVLAGDPGPRSAT